MEEDSLSSNHRHCPACGQRESYNRGRKNGFLMLSCQTCATLFTATSPEENQQQDYDAYYTAENLTVPAFINSILDGIVATFEAYRKNNRLLDVGCGAGTFLEAAARAGWEGLGVEVSRTAAEHVSSKGFEVFCGQLENAGYPVDRFDVVILSEVLEHVPDPLALLEASVRVLRPGGLLWGTTPHGRGISARLLGLGWSTICPPEHLQLFSFSGLRRLLTSEPLSRVEVVTHGTNPFEILHSLRPGVNRGGRHEGDAPVKTFDRVESSYQLNERLSGGAVGRILKATLNNLLNATRMGDSLKIHAEKRSQ